MGRAWDEFGVVDAMELNAKFDVGLVWFGWFQQTDAAESLIHPFPTAPPPPAGAFTTPGVAYDMSATPEPPFASRCSRSAANRALTSSNCEHTSAPRRPPPSAGRRVDDRNSSYASLHTADVGKDAWCPAVSSPPCMIRSSSASSSSRLFLLLCFGAHVEHGFTAHSGPHAARIASTSRVPTSASSSSTRWGRSVGVGDMTRRTLTVSPLNLKLTFPSRHSKTDRCTVEASRTPTRARESHHRRHPSRPRFYGSPSARGWRRRTANARCVRLRENFETSGRRSRRRRRRARTPPMRRRGVKGTKKHPRSVGRFPG